MNIALNEQLKYMKKINIILVKKKFRKSCYNKKKMNVEIITYRLCIKLMITIRIIVLLITSKPKICSDSFNISLLRQNMYIQIIIMQAINSIKKILLTLMEPIPGTQF